MTTDRPTVLLRHNQISLALHCLRDGDGPKLLLLHGLGESSPATLRNELADAWPGAIYALDFTGHGASKVPTGGGYSAELLMGDVDAALVELGEVSILGRGLGAYVALLIAGARPALVRGVVLADGPGLTGGPTGPTSASIIMPMLAAPSAAASSPDPWALAELTHDLRPPDYALSYATKAMEGSGLSDPIVVSAISRPPWLTAVLNQPGVRSLDVVGALRLLASIR
jgi:pimeloyl-ACP methyl ester carboxylesterase